jgi:hypothetical protein
MFTIISKASVTVSAGFNKGIKIDNKLFKMNVIYINWRRRMILESAYDLN